MSVEMWYWGAVASGLLLLPIAVYLLFVDFPREFWRCRYCGQSKIKFIGTAAAALFMAGFVFSELFVCALPFWSVVTENYVVSDCTVIREAAEGYPSRGYVVYMHEEDITRRICFVNEDERDIVKIGETYKVRYYTRFYMAELCDYELYNSCNTRIKCSEKLNLTYIIRALPRA